jgi:ketosteroid isomerase-like protein
MPCRAEKENGLPMPTTHMTFETPEQTEAAFYDAISRADVDAVMALWADEENVVCIHPGAARLVGHSSIRAAWESIFEQGGVQIRPVQVHVAQNMMTAVHNIIEEVHRTASRQQDIHILATNVYMKTPSGWRLVSHHASVVPGEAPPNTPVSALLH